MVAMLNEGARRKGPVGRRTETGVWIVGPQNDESIVKPEAANILTFAPPAIEKINVINPMSATRETAFDLYRYLRNGRDELSPEEAFRTLRAIDTILRSLPAEEHAAAILIVCRNFDNGVTLDEFQNFSNQIEPLLLSARDPEELAALILNAYQTFEEASHTAPTFFSKLRRLMVPHHNGNGHHGKNGHNGNGNGHGNGHKNGAPLISADLITVYLNTAPSRQNNGNRHNVEMTNAGAGAPTIESGEQDNRNSRLFKDFIDKLAAEWAGPIETEVAVAAEPEITEDEAEASENFPLAKPRTEEERKLKRAKLIQKHFISKLNTQKTEAGISDEAIAAVQKVYEHYWRPKRWSDPERVATRAEREEAAKNGKEAEGFIASERILAGEAVLAHLGPVVGILGDLWSPEAVAAAQLAKDKLFYEKSVDQSEGEQLQTPGNPEPLAIMLNLYDIMKLVDVDALPEEYKKFFIDMDKLEERLENGEELTSEERKQIRQTFQQFRQFGQQHHWRLQVKPDPEIDGQPIPAAGFSTTADGRKVIQFIEMSSVNPELSQIMVALKERKGRRGVLFATSANLHGSPEGVSDEDARGVAHYFENKVRQHFKPADFLIMDFRKFLNEQGLPEAEIKTISARVKAHDTGEDQTPVANAIRAELTALEGVEPRKTVSRAAIESFEGRLGEEKTVQQELPYYHMGNRIEYPGFVGSFPAITVMGGKPKGVRVASVDSLITRKALGVDFDPKTMQDSKLGYVKVEPETAELFGITNGFITSVDRPLALTIVDSLQRKQIPPNEIRSILTVLFKN